MLPAYVKNLFLLSLLSLLGVVSGLFFYGRNCLLPDFDTLARHSYDMPSLVLDSQGKELFRFELEHRTPVSLTQVSPHLINAFVAAEDRQFFAHRGVSWRGILRALWINVRARRVSQGASTITQQLVKMLFFSNQRTFERKIREQLVAWVVEGLYSKEQILELYINQVYFGAGLYGVEAAAQRFWGISSSELSPAQAALLAGIVKSPQAYCPLYSIERAQKRRNIVLAAMHTCEYLSDDECAKSCAEAVLSAGRGLEQGRISGHVREMLRQFLEERFGRERLYKDGLMVQTTIDRSMQACAEQAFKKHVALLRNKKAEVDGALVVIEGENGALRALVGGYDFSVSQFNRALQAKRQLGSLIKPIVYSAALSSLGVNFADIRVDEPLDEFYGWSPRNVTRRYDGPMTLAHALAVSNNIIPVRLFFEVGAAPIIALAERLGLPGPMESYPSLALGCVECAPIEVVQMFNAFAQQGRVMSPYYVEWVKDASGKKIFRHHNQDMPGLAWEISSQVLWVLRIIGKRLSRLRPRLWFAGDFACKTGTTNQQRSCWFAGATPKYTGVVYLGCDNNDSLEGVVYSGRHAMPLLVDVLRLYSAADERFYHAPGLRTVFIDPKTGTVLGEQTAQAYQILV